MKGSKLLTLIFYYLFILAALIIGISSIHRLSIKADFPFLVNAENDKLIIKSDIENIEQGRELININNIPVYSLYEVEYLLDSKTIGENVSITVSDSENDLMTIDVLLTSYYKNNLFIIITSIVGLLYWLTGLYVISARPYEKSARILCLTLVTFGIAILTSPGYFERGTDWLGYADRISHTVSYIFGSVFFLHFTFVFPLKLIKNHKKVFSVLYILATLTAIGISILQYVSLRDLNIELIQRYYDFWIIIQLVLILSLLSSTIILPVKYKRPISKIQKEQIEWIYWGIALSVSPFLLFWLIPNVFGLPYLINEEILLTFLILIPFSFAIAVIKYRLFDIDVVIKRSIVYSILMVIIISLYLGIIYFLGKFAGSYFGEEAILFNLLTAVIIALLFSPLKTKVKHFVNSVFYREKYNFDEAVSRITAGMIECKTLKKLGEFLVNEINTVIPVSSIAVVVKTTEGDRLRILEQNNFDNLSKYIAALRVKKLKSKFNLPFAVRNKIDSSVEIDTSLEQVFKKWNINLVIPLILDTNDIVGGILLGDKISGLIYSQFDVELLCPIASSAALAVKRLELQEKLILEEIEKDKLQELSELKSYFVASVSHDLKTPLSSIKIFSELLRNDKITNEKSNEYLEIIDGETDRLARMINNVLDYAKIEKGLKRLNFEKINLNDVVESVMNFMKYELHMKKFEVEKQLFDDDIYILGDNDALNSVIVNIISNSVKYSDKNKYVKLSTSMNDENALVKIEDKGVGIPQNKLKEIFNPYFRVNGTDTSKVKGTGLGLSIVKYILDEHNGKIEVESEVGKGSVFIIKIPLIKNE